jgi:hypothetical protein
MINSRPTLLCGKTLPQKKVVFVWRGDVACQNIGLENSILESVTVSWVNFS